MYKKSQKIYGGILSDTSLETSIEGIDALHYHEDIIKMNKEQISIADKFTILKDLKSKYTPYCFKLIQNNTLEAINYIIQKVRNNTW